jgi:MoaA/NifB/PqqE/SkfB family radical SAM enzyme
MAVAETEVFATFGEYMFCQSARAFSSGPPLGPAVTAHLPVLLGRMTRAQALRERALRERGVPVPAVLFLAVTSECNYSCSHCYTQGYDTGHMDLALAERILSEAYDLGVALIIVTGGEPLLHREFFSLPPAMPDLPFMVFTNGTLVPTFLEEGAASPNMLWVVSVDGPWPWNDIRRGPGSYDMAVLAMDALRISGLPFGFSSALTADNAGAALDRGFVSQMADLGCRAGIFIEQLPAPPTHPPLGQQIARGLARCRRVSPIPLVGFPADEVRYGGCQAGGEGIIHISPEGLVEPCPAAHIAVDSLGDVSLEEALAGPFLEEFRRLKDAVTTGEESCAYVEHEAGIQAGLADLGCRATV